MEYDGSIHQEKIGTSKYVWSFESEERVRNLTKLEKLENELKQIEQDTIKWDNKLESVKEERKDPARQKQLDGIQKLEEDTQQMEANVASALGCDMEQYGKYQQGIQIAKDAAERWTDNIFSICKFIKSKTSMKQSDILKQFGLPADFDYIE